MSALTQGDARVGGSETLENPKTLVLSKKERPPPRPKVHMSPRQGNEDRQPPRPR